MRGVRRNPDALFFYQFVGDTQMSKLRRQRNSHKNIMPTVDTVVDIYSKTCRHTGNIRCYFLSKLNK